MRISTSDTSKDDMSEPRFPQLLTVSHSSGHSGRFGHEFLGKSACQS
jgi:hypothetical protein